MSRNRNQFILLLAAGLVSVSVLPVLNGCTSTADSGRSETIETTTDVPTTTHEETASDREDEVGDYDFGGDEFRAATCFTKHSSGSIYAAEETGDVLNDAVYRRNRLLEERFNFVIAVTIMENDTNAARTAVLAGDASNDIITARCTSAFDYAAEGIVIPIDSLPIIDLEKAYWDQNITESLSIMGKHSFAMGDYNLSSYGYIHLMLFNKKLAKDYGVGDLYAIVNDGKWTFDKYVETAKLATSDINGDGAMTIDDSYGYLSSYKQVPPNFWIAAGELSMEKDSEGRPLFSMASDENFINVFTRIFEITWDENTWFFLNSLNDMPDQFVEAFQNDRALLIDCNFTRVSVMRTMDADFGIIPYPKYTEAQEQYFSRLEYCSLTCVPITNTDLEMTGVILETLACESAKTVVPAFYNISLQTKFTRDEESVEMLDLIFRSRVFDWGDTIFSPEVRDGAISSLFAGNNRDIVSKIASMENSVNKKIEKLVSAFDNIQ